MKAARRADEGDLRRAVPFGCAAQAATGDAHAVQHQQGLSRVRRRLCGPAQWRRAASTAPRTPVGELHLRRRKTGRADQGRARRREPAECEWGLCSGWAWSPWGRVRSLCCQRPCDLQASRKTHLEDNGRVRNKTWQRNNRVDDAEDQCVCKAAARVLEPAAARRRRRRLRTGCVHGGRAGRGGRPAGRRLAAALASAIQGARPLARAAVSWRRGCSAAIQHLCGTSHAACRASCSGCGDWRPAVLPVCVAVEQVSGRGEGPR
jgi:hypothetical protein